MDIRILTIAFDPKKGDFDSHELSAFCNLHKVLRTEVEFFEADGRQYWSVLLIYEPLQGPKAGKQREKLQIKEGQGVGTQDRIPSESEKVLFEKLKTWRLETSRQEKGPPYLIATDRELWDIIFLACRSKVCLETVKGIGKKKVERYGEEILKIVRPFFPHEKKKNR